MMSDELRTIRAVQAGETEAFRVLVDRYRHAVIRFTRNLVRDQDAEDVAQDVFLAAFRRIASFDPQQGRFATWLLAIARNRCVSLLRDRRESVDKVQHLDARPNVREADALDFGRRLDRALDALPLEQKTAFVLAEIEGIAHAEIAEIEGVAVGTIKSRVSRAKEKLRDSLKPLWEDALK